MKNHYYGTGKNKVKLKNNPNQYGRGGMVRACCN